MTNYSPQVFLIPFYHLKENQLSISFSLKSVRKFWARSPATEAQSISVHQSFTQTLNLVVGMFGPLVISKAFSRISVWVMRIFSFRFSDRYSHALLSSSWKRTILVSREDFAWLLPFLMQSFWICHLDSCVMTQAHWWLWSWIGIIIPTSFP